MLPVGVKSRPGIFCRPHRYDRRRRCGEQVRRERSSACFAARGYLFEQVKVAETLSQ